ncbi:MAG: response regulator [Deltaproteobacteria bacterium]|nr:response regulator [Deltaproteobacteria bacterium]
MPTTILLVDDHPIFRHGLRQLIEREKDLKVVGEAGNGLEAIERFRELSPDIVVMDIAMPNIDGIEATRQILSEFPTARVVALSVHSGKQFVKDMLKAGASGYILKESVPEEMILGIRTVMGGDVYLSVSISGILVSEYKKLLSAPETATEFQSEPILRSKLIRPPLAADIIPRARLIEALEEGRERALSLISAPAGYGKSILASQWLEVCGWPHAWLSLDTSDNDQRMFLTYLLAAMEKVIPGDILKSKLLLQAAEPLPVKVLATYLLNDLEEVEQPFILVLDDYHHISNSAVHDLLGELLRYPSPMMHLMLLTRRDPPLPIGSLRARGLLTELSIQHLRFTPAETTAFLGRVLREPIDEDVAATLDARMEGWVTGLRLASLTLGRKEDMIRVLRGLKEDTHYITDYLIREVLSAVPPAMARNLMATSIPDRFCAPLIDVLSLSSKENEETEEPLSAEAFIDWLEKTHMFVIPLDEQRHWFRYHHLFQDLLQRELKQRYSTEELATLHSRAGEWFESHALITESIERALTAGDAVCAAEIIERHRNDEFTADRWHVVEQWLAKLPDDIRRERPKLLLTEAWIRNLQHQLERVPMLLDEAESLLQSQTEEPTVSGEIAFFRGYISYFEGQGELSLQYFEDSVSQLSGTNSPFLGEVELMLGLGRCMVGRKDPAIRGLKARIGEVDSSENYLRSRLIAALAFIYLLSGDLYAARIEAHNLQRMSRKHNLGLAEAWSYYFIACTHLHTGELEAASLLFSQAVELGYVLEPRAALDALAGLALTQQLMGLDEKAAESSRRLQEFVQELGGRNYLSLVQSCQARLSLLRGDLNSAVDWGRSVDESPVPAELFTWLEAPSITRSRVLIAAGSEQSLQKACKLLQSTRELCEACRFTCQIIETAVLQTVALEKLGRNDEALKALKEVLVLAQPGGWIRPFVEAGPPMADLLIRLQKQNVAVEYIESILAAFPPYPRPTVAPSPRPQPLVEPLTNREIDTLELLAERYQNKEIAEKLFISTTTVKSHLKNIYQKLNVGNRREAVEKARALGIL